MQQSFKTRVLDFWKAFEEEENIIRDMIDKNVDSKTLLSFTESILKIAFHEIQFQLGVNIESKYELILTPQGDRAKLIQYYYWCKLAPESLSDRWSFYSSKPAIGDTTDGIDMFGISLTSSEMLIYPKKNTQLSKIDLEIYCPKLLSPDLTDSHRYSIFFIFLDQHIGEYYTIQYIGDTQFISNKKKRKAIDINSLTPYINNTIKKNGWIRSSNPIDSFISYKVTPNIASNWKLREDISYGYSSCTAPISAYHFKDNSFFNEYKKDGVIFGFLFYENSDIENENLISLRATIEDKIIEEAALDNVANCIGGATGFHFSYIDFVIYDFESFKDIIANIISHYNFDQVGINYFNYNSKPILIKQ